MGVNYNTTAVNRGLLFSCDFANPKNYLRAENLISSSETFSSAYWSGNTANILSTNQPDPVGTNTATFIQASAQSYGGFIRSLGQVYGQNTTYTMSVYAKAGSWNYIGLRPSGDLVNLSDAYTYFNLSTGVATSLADPRFSSTVLASGMTPVGNGWYRCWMTARTGSLGLGSGVTDISIVGSTGSSIGVSGNRFNGTETVYIWGAQLERNSTLGTYIQTTGTSRTASVINELISGLTGSLNNIDYYRYDNTTNSINFDRSAATVTGGFAQFTGTGNLTASNFFYNDHTMEIFARINDYNGSNINVNEGSNGLFLYQGYHAGFLYDNSTGLYYGLWGGNPIVAPSWVYPSRPTVGTWFHAVATRSGTTTTIYLNGQSVASSSYTINGNPGIADLIKIGAGNPTPGPYGAFSKMNASIARMYNVALTPSEVLQNFNAFRGRGGM
jgi:hypothetical protein